MKYNNSSILKKLISFLLVCVLSLCFTACNSGEESGSNSSVESVIEPSFASDQAIELIKRDRLITDIFINNSLCEDKSLDAVALLSGEYSSFSEIEALLDSTYTVSGGNKEFFLSYPENHIASVSGIDGKTFVFNHIGSSYDDFINESSVLVENGANENEMLIKCKTELGKGIELKAVCENDIWRLEKGVYMLNGLTPTKTYKKFPLSEYGSFMEFSGNVLVIELFVTDNQSEFTSSEETEFHKRVENAVGYIKEQASSYGNEVNVTYESAYFDHAGVLGTRALDFDIVFAETGFGSLQSFADANFDLAAYDNYVFVVCMNKNADVSYACYNGSDEKQIYFAERLIMGKNTTDIEVCVSLLRLLGAYSFNEGLCDEYTESLYNEYFPHDIMVSESLAYSVMSPVTAYACGITDELIPIYRVFFYE